MDKLTLLKKLNDILSISFMHADKGLESMMNYSGKEIKKFVIWPKGVDFTNYINNDIIKNKTTPQNKLTTEDITSGNFDILQCLKDNTVEKYSVEKYLQLYEENIHLLSIEDNY